MNFLSILLYNTAIQLYGLGIKIYAPFNRKARQWSRGRKDILKQISSSILLNDKIIWVHCASVGEFEQGRPVMEELAKAYPHCKIMLTFSSPSGYELRKKFPGAHYIFYLPLDTKNNAREFIRIVQPKLAVFVKYEFWYNYLHELHEKQIPTLLISGIFRSDQLFFKWYGKNFQQLLHRYKQIFVQDKKSFDLLKELGLNNVTLSSDTRFDRVAAIAAEAKSIPVIESFKAHHQLLIGGSTWQEDEELLVRFINEEQSKFPGYKFILVPHEVDKAHINLLKQKLKVQTLLFSEANNNNIQQATVLIIDNVGMLSSLYNYSKIAYIGGGFGKGIHNILEAAVFGTPVIFGANYRKFNEARELIELKGGFTISNYNELKNTLQQLIEGELFYNRSSEACSKYVKLRTGATRQIMDYLQGKNIFVP